MESGTLRGISPSTRRKVSSLLETLRKDPNFELFIHPIDPVNDGCLDYFEVIKTPMDLLTVSNKLLDDQYKNVNEMYQDIILIFSNCREYNTSPLCSHIIELCNKSENRFLLEWTKLGFSDQSAKKRLEELSKETTNHHAPQTYNKSSTQKHVKLRSNNNNNSNSKANPSRVVLKIDKTPPSLTPPCNTNNKRQKSESNKKLTNNVIPLKKRRENDRSEPTPMKHSSSNKDATPNKHTQTNVSGNPPSDQKKTNPDPDDPTLAWKNECLRILNLLRKEHNSFLFENPVLESEDLTEETKNRYREVIPEACDYITIEKNLIATENLKKHHHPSSYNSRRKSSNNNKNTKTNSSIDNPHEFERLVKLIFSNCMTFNPNSGDCKWIYDSAKQSLNKFNNLWNKSNVFLLYSNTILSTPNNQHPSSAGNNNINTNNNLADTCTDIIKDHQSDTTSIGGGFSITTTIQNKNNTSPRLATPHNTANSSLHNNIKSNLSSRNTNSSSFNKIITQWNNYSIVWRQFILNKHNNHSKPLITNVNPSVNVNVSIRKSSRSNRNKSNSCGNTNKQISFEISPNNNNNNNTITKCIRNVRKFFDFDNNKSHDSNNMVVTSIMKDGDDDYHQQHPVFFKSSNNLDLPRKSNCESEYIFPLQIYDLNAIKTNKNILNMIHHHRSIQGGGDGNNYCHSMHVKVSKGSIIFLYCFQSSMLTKLQGFNNRNDYNSISNQHYFAYTNNNEFINRFIELKVTIPKPVNDFIMPIFKQYHFDDILISNVNIVINNIVNDNFNSVINVQLGEIL